MNRLGFVGMFVLFGLAVGTLFAHETAPPPVSITDSLTDNANGVVFYKPGPGSNWKSGPVFLVYEKSFDSTATALYWRNLTTRGPQTPLLVAPHVHYRHPKILLGWNAQKPAIFLFFETDENGNWDIRFFYFQSLDSLTGPFDLAHSVPPDAHLSTATDAIVFQRAGAILFSRLSSKNVHFWTEPVVLDSGNCSYPTISGESGEYCAAWIRQDGGRSKLFYSFRKFNAAWEPPQLLLREGEDFSPGFAKRRNAEPLLCWKNVESDQTRLYVWDYFFNEQLFYQFSTFDTIRAPSLFNYVIPTLQKGKSENKAFSSTFLLSYLKHTSNGDSIFWIDHSGQDRIELVSGDSLTKRNPKLYEGVFNEAVDVWERKINGHWQLRMAVKSYPQSDVKGNAGNFAQAFELFPNYPNPFKTQTTIELALPFGKTATLSIYNILGQKVWQRIWTAPENRKFHFTWDGRSSLGQKLPNGIYFYQIRVGRKIIRRKMILLR